MEEDSRLRSISLAISSIWEICIHYHPRQEADSTITNHSALKGILTLTRDWNKLLANLEFSLLGDNGRLSNGAFRMGTAAFDRKLLLPHGEANQIYFDLNRVDTETTLTYKFKIQK